MNSLSISLFRKLNFSVQFIFIVFPQWILPVSYIPTYLLLPVSINLSALSLRGYSKQNSRWPVMVKKLKEDYLYDTRKSNNYVDGDNISLIYILKIDLLHFNVGN